MMVLEDLYKKVFFFQKELMFCMVKKTKQKLLFENYECFSKMKNNVKSLFLLKTLTCASYGYRYSPNEPGFDLTILKIFVVNADSLFAKSGKLTTR